MTGEEKLKIIVIASKNGNTEQIFRRFPNTEKAFKYAKIRFDEGYDIKIEDLTK